MPIYLTHILVKKHNKRYRDVCEQNKEAQMRDRELFDKGRKTSDKELTKTGTPICTGVRKYSANGEKDVKKTHSNLSENGRNVSFDKNEGENDNSIKLNNLQPK